MYQHAKSKSGADTVARITQQAVIGPSDSVEPSTVAGVRQCEKRLEGSTGIQMTCQVIDCNTGTNSSWRTAGLVVQLPASACLWESRIPSGWRSRTRERMDDDHGQAARDLMVARHQRVDCMHH